MPTVIVAFSIVLAITLIQVDSAENDIWLAQWPHLFGAGAEGARGMLSTLAGSMMSVMGITFSMTLVALALVANQYTSRILRNFMRSIVTQASLGIFAGIFTYCLIVLRTIRSGDEGTFVPGLAVFFGFVLALGGVGVLIFFIHLIASSIQASSIIASVAQETIAAIDRLFPDKSESEFDKDENQVPRPIEKRNWHVILAKKSGYILRVWMMMRCFTWRRTGIPLHGWNAASAISLFKILCWHRSLWNLPRIMKQLPPSMYVTK